MEKEWLLKDILLGVELPVLDFSAKEYKKGRLKTPQCLQIRQEENMNHSTRIG